MTPTLCYCKRCPLCILVEGAGEYACFPSLVARITPQVPFSRVSRASGCGDVVVNLHSHLDDMTKLYHPMNVMITVDLSDVLKRYYKDCQEAISSLQNAACEWLSSRRNAPRFEPLPEYVVVVVVNRKLESWMVADVGGVAALVSHGLGGHVAPWTDVDTQCEDPCAWLATHAPHFNSKSPEDVKALMSCISIEDARCRSRSFRKFAKEVELSGWRWKQCSSVCATSH